MTKPSERIVEIYSKLTKDESSIYSMTNAYLKAITGYLDEQWEKAQPCREHNYVGPDELCSRCLKPRFTPV